MATQSKQSQQEETAEVRATRATGKARKAASQKASSRDVMASLEVKIDKANEKVAELITRCEDGDESLEELKQVVRRLEASQNLSYQTIEGLTQTDEASNARTDGLEAMVTALRAELEELRATIGTVRTEMRTRRTTTGFGGITAVQRQRFEVPRPKEFSGKREAKEVDNFLWSMDQYFKAIGVDDDETKVSSISSFLNEFALVWWRNKYGSGTIRTWAQFEQEFRKYYYPVYANDEARGKLRRLSQSRDLRKYVREFSELMLMIPDLTDREALFQFMDGLKPWAKQEMQRRNVQDVHEAMVVAETMVEFDICDDEVESSSRNHSSGNGGGANGSQPKGGQSRASNGSWKSNNDGDKREISCFLCERPHRVRDCPKKGKLASISKESDDEEEEEPLKVGSIMLNTIRSKKSKKLMFVDIKVMGNPVRALVDTGATNLFMSENLVKKLGMKVMKGEGTVKTVNSEPIPTTGVAHSVELRLGEWEGKESIDVIPFDDFDLVIGVEFLDRIKAIIVPFANYIAIAEKSGQCVLDVKRERKTGAKSISAIQFARGVEKDTYLDALPINEPEESEECESNIPEGLKVLPDFKDGKPARLPQYLPPKGEVGHLIGVVPKLLAPHELEELKGAVDGELDITSSDYTKMFELGQEDPNWGVADEASVGMRVSDDRVMETVFVDQVHRWKGHKPGLEYLIEWKGQPDAEGSWEPARDPWQSKDLVDASHSEDATRASLEPVGESDTGQTCLSDAIGKLAQGAEIGRQARRSDSSPWASAKQACHGTYQVPLGFTELLGPYEAPATDPGGFPEQKETKAGTSQVSRAHCTARPASTARATCAASPSMQLTHMPPSRQLTRMTPKQAADAPASQQAAHAPAIQQAADAPASQQATHAPADQPLA